MRKVLPLLLGFIVLSIHVFAQTPVGAIVGNQKVIEVPIAPAGYAKTKALQWLPDDYTTSGKQYPLMIFLHNAAIGQSNDIAAMISTSLPQLISQGLKPYGIDPITNDTLKYVVISPHAAGTSWSYSYGHIKYLLPYLIANFRIDPSRVYISGTSAGGWGVWSIPSEDVNFTTTNIAAIVPIAGVEYNTSKYENIKSCVRNNLGIWQICGAQDAHVATARRYDQVIKSALVNQNNYGYIEVPGADHNEAAWNPPFQLNNTWFRGKNLWSRLLDYKVGGAAAPPPNQAPAASAGPDQQINLPTSSTTVNGSGTDADGTIASYNWTKTSGGTATISSPGAASTSITNLAQGTYVFRLTVTDDKGTTGYDDMVINVQQSGTPAPATKVEAESYIGMNGVQTESTRDIGGGLNVGWINNGDWMDYSVNLPVQGIYTVKFRIATADQGGEFQLRASNGTVLATIVVPNTGSYQNWFTVSQAVNLSAGTQNLRLVSTKNPGWNINWMEFVPGEAYVSVPGKLEAESYAAMSGIQTEATQDTGNGLNVGWIDHGDWLEYNVNVGSSGMYNVNVRVAAQAINGRCEIRNANGTALATINIPATGGVQTWQTVSANVSLPAGQQKLRIVSTNSPIWNLNWLEFVAANNARVVAASTSNIADGIAGSVLSTDTTLLFPNPIQDAFTLKILNNYTGAVKVRVLDISGSIKQEFDYTKDQVSLMKACRLQNNLASGNYIVQVVMGQVVKTFKVVKL